MERRGFADAHTHIMGDDTGRYPDIDDAVMMVSCTAERSDWDTLRGYDDPRIVKSYGIHPWYADQWDSGCESELISILEEDPRACIGEIGLDRNHGDMDLQLSVFRRQLSIASEYGRVASVHMIGCEKEILDSARSLGKGCPGIVLHSFKGPESYVKAFSGCDCYFSVNPRILKSSNDKVFRILSSIPIDRLLLETDAPNQGDSFDGMGRFAESLSGIMGDDMNILDITCDNARRLFDV